MTITLRSAKGVELTHGELDGNFTDLDGRVTTLEGVNSLDSAATTAVVDSDYVQARALQMSKYFFEADSGDTTFTGADDYGNSLLYDSSTIMVYLNGYLLDENRDFTLTGKNTITTTAGMDSGHALIITTWS